MSLRWQGQRRASQVVKEQLLKKQVHRRKQEKTELLFRQCVAVFSLVEGKIKMLFIIEQKQIMIIHMHFLELEVRITNGTNREVGLTLCSLNLQLADKVQLLY